MELTVSGEHATRLKFLAKIFERYIDVYMSAAVWGIRYRRRVALRPSNDRVRIYADAFHCERANCIYEYVRGGIDGVDYSAELAQLMEQFS